MEVPKKIYGNEPQRKALIDAVLQERLFHAYLFYGADGLGKKSLARWLAAAILCEHPDENGCCGVCRACTQVKKDTHPDLLIAPYDKPLPVAAVREIRARSFVKPNGGRYNVFIIPQADRMESSSFNALLKVLEEPPGNTVFLLTAADKSTMPETISSRCAPVMLSPLSEDACKAAVKELIGADEETVRRAASFADGNLGQALSYCSDGKIRKAESASEELLEAMNNRREYEFLLRLTQSAADKEQFERINEALCRLLRRELLLENTSFSTEELLAVIGFCEETRLSLRRSFAIGILINSYTAGIFSRLAV